MYAGIDFGTSTCALAVWRDGVPELVPLDDAGPFMLSALHSSQASLPIPRFDVQEVRRRAGDAADREREEAIQRGVMRREMAEAAHRRQGGDAPLYFDPDIVFGKAALDNYLFDPQHGFYAKSPKSFLGSDLQGRHLGLFAEIITRMMAQVKQCSEAQIGQVVEKVVIGRPVNFHGTRGEQGNRQALHILEQAATAVGFDEIAFLYEPIAAALDYERQLETDRTVLVLDAGAGTTDCSMVRVGPTYRHMDDRASTLLGSAGTRIGGIDFDINLGMKAFMPSFGKDMPLTNGLPFPGHFLWDALTVNDINAQARFYAKTTPGALQGYRHIASDSNKIDRLLRLWEERLGQGVVREAEQAKIGLSESRVVTGHLHDIEPHLSVTVTREQLRDAVELELNKFVGLMADVQSQAQVPPDAIYVTGGTAKSPLVIEMIRQHFSDIEVITGDYFGSVTSGLATWAHRLFGRG
jgi:hypothetical chaperone protein